MDKKQLEDINKIKDKARKQTPVQQKAMEIGREQAKVAIVLIKEKLYNRSDFYTGSMRIEKVYGLLSKIELNIRRLWQQ